MPGTYPDIAEKTFQEKLLFIHGIAEAQIYPLVEKLFYSRPILGKKAHFQANSVSFSRETGATEKI